VSQISMLWILQQRQDLWCLKDDGWTCQAEKFAARLTYIQLEGFCILKCSWTSQVWMLKIWSKSYLNKLTSMLVRVEHTKWRIPILRQCGEYTCSS
jgi:hypothetical protein